MAYQPLDPAFPQTDQTIPTVLGSLLLTNAEEASTLRLKACGATYWPGASTDTDGATAALDNVPGTEGVTSYSSTGVAQYSNDTKSVGLWVSTPVQRPLVLRFPWPLSANARRIRVVVTCSVTSPTDGTVDLVAMVNDGVQWYGATPTPESLVSAPSTVPPSNDPVRFSAEIEASDAFASVGTSIAHDSVTFVSLEVDLSGRPTWDTGLHRTGDIQFSAEVCLAVLSRLGDTEVTQDHANVVVHEPRNLLSIPGTRPNYVGPAHFVLALTDSAVTDYRLYHVSAAGPDPTIAETRATAPDIDSTGDTWLCVWPPARQTTLENSELTQHLIIPNSTIRIIAVSIQELPNA